MHAKVGDSMPCGVCGCLFTLVPFLIPEYITCVLGGSIIFELEPTGILLDHNFYLRNIICVCVCVLHIVTSSMQRA